VACGGSFRKNRVSNTFWFDNRFENQLRGLLSYKTASLRSTKHPDNVLSVSPAPEPVCLNNSSMGRPKDFPNIYQDLLTKYKAKGIADKEYKECLLLARVSCPLLLFSNSPLRCFALT
jgi:hypothetical protein